MAKEIERKFLVEQALWKPHSEGISIRQGYLNSDPERVVRVRTKGEKAFMTVKGKNEGIVRAEFEYQIPYQDAEQMFFLCEQPLIEKRRYEEIYYGNLWEIDCFFGDNKGLIVAEIELKSQEESFIKPAWVGDEVSSDSRYYNSNLRKNPYREWKK